MTLTDGQVVASTESQGPKAGGVMTRRIMYAGLTGESQGPKAGGVMTLNAAKGALNLSQGPKAGGVMTRVDNLAFRRSRKARRPGVS